VRSLHRTPEHLIVKARLEMEMKRLERQFAPAKPELWKSIQNSVQSLKKALEEAAERYAKAANNYFESQEGFAQRSRDSLLSAKRAFKEKRRELHSLMKTWHGMLRPLVASGL